MTYQKRQSGTVAQDVGLALTTSYIPTPKAGTYGHHLGVCVLHALKRDVPGQYLSALSDLAVTVEEIQGPPAGETRFEVRDADQIKSDGKQSLQGLVSPWAVSLAQQTISYGVGTVNPLFSILANTMFDHAGGASYEGQKARTKLALRDAKKWSFRKWHRKPGSLVLGLETAYLLAANASGTRVSGPVDYEVTVSATTGKRLHSPRGRLLQQTGTITDTISFTVNWQ